MRTFLLFPLFVALLFLSGCGGNTGLPDDMPRLFQVNITIKQEGVALEGATVTLEAKTPSKYGTASGTTDASGVVKPRTYGHNGVPAGEYVVKVDKITVEGAREVALYEGETPTLVGGTRFRVVDARFTGASSDLTITVADKGATNETFDVGAAVRISLGNITE